MTIPKGVNFIDFVIKAKEKGIKINSRYSGVTMKKSNSNKDFVWDAQVSINGKTKHAGTFPLTEEGEYRAYQAAERLKLTRLKLNNTSPTITK